MRILFAADGSKYTKKALAFLITHEALAQPGSQLYVINVQPAMPPRVKSMVGASAVTNYQREEAARVLAPIDRFLKRKDIKTTALTAIGVAGEEIVRAAEKIKPDMIVMGTHGHGIVGRALMGSVAQRVVHDSNVPVLLVK